MSIEATVAHTEASTSSRRHPSASPSPLPTAIALTILAVCALDLVGWLFHLPLLTSILPHYATMKPNSAICLAALSIVLLLDRSTHRLAPAITLFLLAATVAVSATTVAEYITHRALLGLDQIFLAVPPGVLDAAPGRMSLATAVCLLLTALSLFLLDRIPPAALTLTLLATAITFSGILGFFFQAGPLTGVPWLKTLAIHTATAIFLLQIAVFAIRPAREPFRLLNQGWRTEGRRRYLLFAVTLLPGILALPVLAGLRHGLYDAPFAMAFLLVLLIFLQTLLLWTDNRTLEQVESRLRESESRSSRILESIGDAVIVTDAETRVTRMNPVAESLTGWSIAQARGLPLAVIFNIIGEATREPAESPADKVKRLGIVVGLSNHTLLIRKDNTEIAIDDSGAPIRNDDGSLAGIVLVFRSVDDRRKTEKALLQSEKLAAVGRLAACIAHEINNPLEAVTNLIYLARHAENSAEANPLLDLADRELRRASVISSQTLRFHRQSTKPLSVTCEDLLETVLSISHGRIGQLRIHLETRHRAKRPILCFDGEIRQVLNNLISNAIDAMTSTGGRLLIRSRETTHWPTARRGIVITVADTGSGIAPEDAKRIFDAFFTTKGTLGNGLGLWVSREIVQRHRGFLHPRSSPRGTVFSLFLPAEAAPR